VAIEILTGNTGLQFIELAGKQSQVPAAEYIAEAEIKLRTQLVVLHLFRLKLLIRNQGTRENRRIDTATTIALAGHAVEKQFVGGLIVEAECPGYLAEIRFLLGKTRGWRRLIDRHGLGVTFTFSHARIHKN